MQTKERRTMSNRDLDRTKAQLNGYHDEDGDQKQVFDPDEVAGGKNEYPEVLGIAVPFSLETEKGSLRCYLSLSPQPTKKRLINTILTLAEREGFKFAYYGKGETGGGFK
jgi:hypothetical protein